jgi:hypothetical protein
VTRSLETGLYAAIKRAECGLTLRYAPKRFLRKEVIQPQVPLRLPCYDFTPVTNHSLGGCLLAVGLPTSGAIDSHGVTGGVYKARERIHPCLLIRDY